MSRIIVADIDIQVCYKYPGLYCITLLHILHLYQQYATVLNTFKMLFLKDETPGKESTEVVFDYFLETYKIVPHSYISEDFFSVNIFKPLGTSRLRSSRACPSNVLTASTWISKNAMTKRCLKGIRNGTIKRLWVRQTKGPPLKQDQSETSW